MSYDSYSDPDDDPEIIDVDGSIFIGGSYFDEGELLNTSLHLTYLLSRQSEDKWIPLQV